MRRKTSRAACCRARRATRCCGPRTHACIPSHRTRKPHDIHRRRGHRQRTGDRLLVDLGVPAERGEGRRRWRRSTAAAGERLVRRLKKAPPKRGFRSRERHRYLVSPTTPLLTTTLTTTLRALALLPLPASGATPMPSPAVTRAGARPPVVCR